MNSTFFSEYLEYITVDEIRENMKDGAIIVQHCWSEFEGAYKSIDSLIKEKGITDLSKFYSSKDRATKEGFDFSYGDCEYFIYIPK